ncbi:MAG: VOC family protein [Capsulimonas sp.]|uniref:VOC family protein n=1 Tax=Capsulimonas sp. TaxID=2494211 RepID=UPI00326671E7
MMTLNHLNLCVRDVPEARTLFTTYFGFRALTEKEKPPLAVLEGENGFVLVLSRFTDETPVYPKAFHIGFMQESPEKVWEVYRTLQAGGVTLPHEPRPVHGSFGFYFTALGGILIEVGAEA